MQVRLTQLDILLFCNMSNGYFNFANSKEFHDLMLNLHPSNDAAFEYGSSYGKDFDPDYKSIIEVHSYKAPKATHLNTNFPWKWQLLHCYFRPTLFKQMRTSKLTEIAISNHMALAYKATLLRFADLIVLAKLSLLLALLLSSELDVFCMQLQ